MLWIKEIAIIVIAKSITSFHVFSLYLLIVSIISETSCWFFEERRFDSM